MIAIHPQPGSFSDQWIAWCDAHGVSYRLVDCYRSNIIQQLKGCHGLMWHWAHYDRKAALFARQLTLSLEQAGIASAPIRQPAGIVTISWARNICSKQSGTPLIPSHVFYDRMEALQWVAQTNFPKVFKQRGGAGSENVQLARSKEDAVRFIHRSFGRGWKANSRFHFLKERLWNVRRDRTLRSIWSVSPGPAADSRIIPDRPCSLWNDHGFWPRSICLCLW